MDRLPAETPDAKLLQPSTYTRGGRSPTVTSVCAGFAGSFGAMREVSYVRQVQQNGPGCGCGCAFSNPAVAVKL
jgi:hypothetical protein